ncbi:MAG: hypothetical protein M1826_005490 [Phylliscum demangeonii]|nr:MAG: hypothetical protein M1826_005490 [Phylliscum demangeonii]
MPRLATPRPPEVRPQVRPDLALPQLLEAQLPAAANRPVLRAAQPRAVQRQPAAPRHPTTAKLLAKRLATPLPPEVLPEVRPDLALPQRLEAQLPAAANRPVLRAAQPRAVLRQPPAIAPGTPASGSSPAAGSSAGANSANSASSPSDSATSQYKGSASHKGVSSIVALILAGVIAVVFLI